MRRTSSGHTYRPAPAHWFVIPAALALALLALGEMTDVDRIVTRLAFDPQMAGFPLRANFWLDVVLHHWTKYAVIMAASIITACLFLSFILPGIRPERRTLAFMVLALSLAPLSITTGKAVSTRHCPWDVTEFGGIVPYERLFEANAAGVDRGHCFPAGHASTGFALMAFYFAAYGRGALKAARVWLVVGIAAGLGLGFARVLQGAHFITHVLWAGILCWCVMAVLYMICLANAPRHDADFTDLRPVAD